MFLSVRGGGGEGGREGGREAIQGEMSRGFQGSLCKVQLHALFLLINTFSLMRDNNEKQYCYFI